ncbi:MAG: hypothetical protein IJ719_02435 [Clostridia bacterium]|nr:hypothetical protein [Clostridia bacterium]
MFISVIKAYITVLAINAIPSYFAVNGKGLLHILKDVLVSFELHPVRDVIFFPIFVYLFHIQSISMKNRRRNTSLIAGSIFSIVLICGFALRINDSILILFDNPVLVIRTSIQFLGYTWLLSAVIYRLFQFIDEKDIKTIKVPLPSILFRIIKYIQSRPFSASFSFLLLCYLPSLVISYPAIFMGDTVDQIKEALSSGPYGNAHPFLHTMIIRLCLKIGLSFSSVNMGIFIYTIIQMLVIILAISWSVKRLSDIGAPIQVQLLLLICYAVTPFLRAYLFLVTKDVLFSAILFLVVISGFSYALEGKKRYFFFLFFFSLLTMLFRLEGIIHVVVFLISIYMIFLQRRKQCLLVIMSCITGYVLWTNIILPALNVIPGSRGEPFSIPFQQTAYYVKKLNDEVEQEEREAIDAVLDYNLIGQNYSAYNADPVKSTFREDCTSEELKRYLLTWLKMGLKHPEIYLNAFISQKYNMFYPITENVSLLYSYGYSQFLMKSNIFQGRVFYPRWTRPIQTRLDEIEEIIARSPIFGISYSHAFIMWILVLWTFYLIDKKAKRSIAFISPLLIHVILLLLGPMDGMYIRYLYPIALILPFEIAMGYTFTRKSA